MSCRISKMIYDYCLNLYTLLCYINLKICILFGDDSKFFFWVIEYFVKKGVVFFYMLRHISITIYDFCFKLYTLLCYINLKICILFGFDSKFYFSDIYFFVKKRGGFHMSRCILKTIYGYCLKLSQKLFMIIT